MGCVLSACCGRKGKETRRTFEDERGPYTWLLTRPQYGPPAMKLLKHWSIDDMKSLHDTTFSEPTSVTYASKPPRVTIVEQKKVHWSTQAPEYRSPPKYAEGDLKTLWFHQVDYVRAKEEFVAVLRSAANYVCDNRIEYARQLLSVHGVDKCHTRASWKCDAELYAILFKFDRPPSASTT